MTPVATTGLTLHGIILLPHATGVAPATVSVIRFRDLGALVRPAPFAPVACTPETVDAPRAVVDAAFRGGTVLPAPCGTVFRSAEQVRQWLVQNYIALSEGIHFVAGRCEVRVRITEKRGEALPADGRPPAAELAAVANECFRLLRRQAVASVPVRHKAADEVLSGAFLIRLEQSTEFAEQVEQQARRYDDALSFAQTGPWPPYDFVRMDFGA